MLINFYPVYNPSCLPNFHVPQGVYLRFCPLFLLGLQAAILLEHFQLKIDCSLMSHDPLREPQ
jgi:hypothetical protein